MATTNLQHRRIHNLLLVSKLLNQRDVASPFTLILDTVEQSAVPLTAEYLNRATFSKVQTILLSFETPIKPRHVEVFVRGSSNLSTWQRELTNVVRAEPNQRKLLVVDNLNALCALNASSLPALLSSFMGPATSLLAIYHQDIPSIPSPATNPYSPHPLVLLQYLATTIFAVQSIRHVVERKQARDRSHEEPTFGIHEDMDGIIQGLGANGADGLVLEMEHRRKSGRKVRESYFLPLQIDSSKVSTTDSSSRTRETVILLEDHPLYRSQNETSGPSSADVVESTFDLGLTDRQRKDRDGVVLPYFDAQKGEGDGGRILYDMGSEDDFDEEEDEI